jgi:hypothetical protein
MDYVSGLRPFFLYAVPRLLATVASSRPKEKIYRGEGYCPCENRLGIGVPISIKNVYFRM